LGVQKYSPEPFKPKLFAFVQKKILSQNVDNSIIILVKTPYKQPFIRKQR